MAIGLLLLYLFLVTSRIFDLLPALSRLRIPMILIVLLMMISVVNGQLFRGLREKGLRLMLALVGWTAVCAVFSIWRVGSLDFVKDLTLSALVFIAVVSTVRTIPDLQKVVAIQVISITVASFVSFVSKADDTRLALSGGTYGDPNGYAAAILQALPLCFMYNSRMHGPIKKLLALSCLLPMLMAFIRTGSRGGMISFVFIGIMVFFQVGFVKKMGLIILSMILGVGFIFFLPQSIRVRYVTIFDSRAEESSGLDLGGASSSSEARLALLRLSLDLTMRHPIFGVGPGMFPVAGDQAAKENGQRRGTWQVSHNTYTQVSSELGIPGLLLFLALIWHGWRASTSVARLQIRGANPEISSLAQLGTVLRLSFFGFAISIFFLSAFYWMTWAIVIACMTCVDRLAKEETAKLTAARSLGR